MLHGFLYLSFAAAVVSLSQAFVSGLSILYLSSTHAALQGAHSASYSLRPPATPAPFYSNSGQGPSPGAGLGSGSGSGMPRVIDSERSNQFTFDNTGRLSLIYKESSPQEPRKARGGSTAVSNPLQRTQRQPDVGSSSSNETPDLSATSPFAPSHTGIYQSLIVYILLLVVSIMQVQ